MQNSIPSLLRIWSDLSPQAPALLGLGRPPLSYQRLLGQVEQVVQTLNEFGIGRSDKVAIVLENGPEMASCFLSVASGATSAPLNPGCTEAEFRLYLSDLRPKAIVVAAESASPAISVANAMGISVLRLFSCPGEPAGVFRLEGTAVACSLDRAQQGFAQPSDVALMLHTSGSTAQPRAVPLTHANLCHSARSIGASLDLGANDRCLNVVSLFHVHGLISALLASLAAGASVVCTPGFDAVSFFDWLDEFQPTWYTAAPAMHHAILGRAASNLDVISRSRLRFIRSGSVPLPPKLRAELENVFHVPVVEAYGMTETASTITSTPLPPRKHKPGSVGMAVHCEIAVMDETGAFLPAGQIGEIVVRGRNVTPGYEKGRENDPRANQNAFTADGWLRTGDEGRIDCDGYLFLTGRIKEIINRGGEKISPREVDEALMDHPAVAEAMAFALPDERLGEDICAAVVLRDSTAAGSFQLETELREFVAARLADFKVPRRVVFLDEIPRGRTGKPQRRGFAEALGLSETGKADRNTPVAPAAGNPEPRNTGAADGVVGTLLTQIWEDILERRPIGAHENFFDLGGYSLLFTRLLARVEKVFRKKLPQISFLEAPTIARMASLLESGANSIAPSQVIPIHSSGSRPPLFILGPMPLFRPLMLRLAEDQPVFAVSVVDTATLPVPYRLEDLAAHYLEVIRKVHPAGPCAFFGWCKDGLLGYEMAQQVLAQEGSIPLVVMIESFVPPSLRREGRWAARKERLKYHFANISTLDARQSVEYIRQRSETIRGNIRAWSWRAFYKSQLRAGRRTRQVLPSAEQIGRLTAREYRPQPFEGRVLLVRAQKRPSGPGAAFGWRGLVHDLEVVDVPGSHTDIFVEPNVEVMAKAIDRQLLEFHHASRGLGTAVGSIG